MDIKEYLGQIELLDIRIQNRKDELDTLKDEVLKVTVPTDKEYIKNNYQESRIEKQLTKLTELQMEYEKEISEIGLRRKEVLKKIELMNNPGYERILYLRYCKMCTWDEIGKDLDISYQWAIELHNRAIKKLKKIINNY